MLSNKYEPKTIDDIKLNDANLDAIIKWCNGWLTGTPPEKPALFLFGYPGIGKTTAAKCIANSCSWELIELNTSNARNREQLQSFTPNESLSGEIPCVLLDEIDSLEKSGEITIRNLIQSKKFPIIVTANDQYKVSKEIKDICENVQIYRPSVNALKTHLLEICQKENLNLPKELIEAASLSQDYRLALGMIDNRCILKGSPKKTSLRDLTSHIIQGERCTLEDSRSLLYYLDENCPKLYTTWDLYKIYEILSRVDMLNKRGQKEYANSLIKTIPKIILDLEIEIISPIKYNKKNDQTI